MPRPTSFLRVLALTGGAILVLLILYIRRPESSPDSTPDPTLHLLIPATSSNAELCKCILSSYILGYPTPTLINWEDSRATSNDNWSFGGSHIAKITGVLRYLDKEHVAKEDLILILDGFDTWFQLPPHVLASRYRQINQKADALTAKIIGQNAVDAEDIYQTILFPAEKVGPYVDRWDQPAAYAVPEPSEREDLYGEGTDGMHQPGEMATFSFDRTKLRPRWLNSGLMIGPQEDMRMLFQAAESHVDTIDHHGSDQVIFAQIFGEQSYQRQVMRLRYQSFVQSTIDWFRNIIGTYEPSIVEYDPRFPTHEHMEWADGHPYEYHVGLDYSLEISFTNTNSEDDAMFLVHNTTTSLKYQQRRLAYLPDPPRVTEIPEDIASSPPPFHSLLGFERGDVDEVASMQWEEVPLYTNVWTTTVPVTIHINGDKDLRGTLWGDMWYFPRLRALMETRAAQAGDRGPGALDDKGEFLDWEKLCAGTDVEVFRDVDYQEY